MKGMMKICLAMAVFFMVGACGNGDAEQWLMRAEGCMETNQDSAYRCLQQIDVSEGLSDEQRARYALRRTQAMHKCRIPLESDSLINVAVTYYADNDDRHRLALSLLYKGLVHKQCGEVTQAVEAFVASEQAFEGVEDNQYKALLFNHYASLLMKQNMFEEALGYYKQSYKCNLMGDSLHYVVSNCGQIANLFLIQENSDSARAYYERGLLHAKECGVDKRKQYYLLLQNYAVFLMKRKEFSKAEKLLLQCLEELSDSDNLHALYPALTSLYSEKGEYAKALLYGRKAIEGNDSLNTCIGYLRLYKIYKGMGETDSAFHYHNLYRQYNSDITMRRKTAEIASIPNRVKNVQLVAENRTLMGWRVWMAVAIVAILAVSVYIFKRVRFRHRQEQQAKNQELEMADKKLVDASVELGHTSAELGRLKGALTNHADAVRRLKEGHRKQLDKHHEKIKRLQESVDKLNADVKSLKDKDRERNHTETALRENFNQLKK